MTEVVIQLSDETFARVKASADALEVSAEQMIAEEVEAMFAQDIPAPEAEEAYRAFVQKGIDAADRGDVEDWEVVKARLRTYMADRTVAAAE